MVIDPDFNAYALLSEFKSFLSQGDNGGKFLEQSWDYYAERLIDDNKEFHTDEMGLFIDAHYGCKELVALIVSLSKEKDLIAAIERAFDKAQDVVSVCSIYGFKYTTYRDEYDYNGVSRRDFF